MLETSQIAARLAVEDTVGRLFVATDERNWPALESFFTTPFTLDMTSVAGGSPTQITGREVAAAWAAAFEPLVSDLKFLLKFIDGNPDLEKSR